MLRPRSWCRTPVPARRPLAPLTSERGYLMVALLVAMSVMAIMMGAALPTWRTLAQREKETELIFRGEQYARAISLYQRRYANAAPPNLDVLVNEKFLRKKYKDPITGEDFQAITVGSPLPGEGAAGQQPDTRSPQGMRQELDDAARRGASAGRQGGPGPGQSPGSGGGGIVGVASRSTARAFRVYNGRDTYNQWVFMGVQQSTRAGGPGGPAGPPGRGGNDGRGGRGATPQQPGRGVQPPGRGAQPPGRQGAPQVPGQRGFGGRNFEN